MKNARQWYILHGMSEGSHEGGGGGGAEEEEEEEEEEELDTILQNHKKIAAISETKKRLKGTKNTRNYAVIYSGVEQSVRAHLGVMIWVHKSLS
jgi:hypothetical protein